MRRGVGLAEVAIAALVLAGALLVIWQALGTGLRGTEQIGEELSGAQGASDVLDAVCAVRPAPTPGEVAPSALLASPPALPAGFQCGVTVDALPATSDGIAAGVLRRVTVAVRWTSGGRASSVRLARLLADDARLER